MSGGEGKVERLDLAPKRTKPLSPWNPWDYLVLLYWVFFFPQALRWYVKTFVGEEYRGTTRWGGVIDGWRNDFAFRFLVQQMLVVVALVLPLVVYSLAAMVDVWRYEVSWGGLHVGVFGGVVAGVFLCLFALLGGELDHGVAICLTGTVSLGAALSFSGSTGHQIFFVDGFAIGLAFGLWGSVNLAFPRVFEELAVQGVVIGFSVAVLAGVFVGLVDSVADGVAVGVVSSRALAVGGSVGFVGACCRVLGWLVQGVWGKDFGRLNRMVWLPLAWVRRRLVVGLESDWEVGVANANQVLDYTLQTISVFRATQEAYAQSSENVVLERSSILARSTHDWDLLYYCSARFDHELRRRAIDGIFWLPSRWKEAWQARYPINLRFDTPARAACAGFWLWHELDAPGAAAAFSHVRHIQHGPELSGIAAALAAAEAATDLESLVAWPEALTWLDNLPDPELRPETLKALRSLRSVALDASTVFHAHSPQNRALAVARAGGELKRLLDREHHACPEPEWPIFEKIAIRWRDILLEAGGVVGEEPLREPIRNPYEGYSGVPVKPPSFVGRGDIFRRIETLWSTTADLPVLILYGHRRMGKTSILRNLERSAPQGTLLVYLDMQDAAFVDHTGQFLLEIAEAVHQRAAAAGLDVGAPPAEVHFDTLGHARRALSKLLDTLDPELRTGRLVLAIDEFEFIEDGIQAGSIDPRVLGYLRSLNQKHPWLALVFGGLHTLDEMGRDYQAAFLAQTENVRVGYLKREDAVRLLTQPSEDFTLDYAPALLNDLWHLTSGQPFLLQRLAGELVMQWNERFLKTGEKTPRMLLPEDLEPVLTDDFYSGASYYFDGVWSNITAPERELLAVLAEREAPWTAEELAEAVGKPVDELAPVLELLRRHDALADPREQGGEASELRFASELLRRWVRRQG